ncbi:Serine phosphatase RsbU, regulator of sigma subunit [Streptomyces zhaozhouensis]|uniref:protein-serine/threonine phosphatase n=1 Tax=Streptomyces zhaozhouensis TaxID=1300267 RepID=A0A286EA03_9ACTN|nr:SpoIIE family protein phosphatase [Streptomyces zhaozhouensis]SOD67709.1 Serine phosphatase RsbU, regulator of sigma subunit [Streptomyces zhaozhouensis]
MGVLRRGSRLSPLEPPVVEALERTGAYGALVHLLRPGATLLHLALISGVPPNLAWQWTRVELASRQPIAEAARCRRLAWRDVQGRGEVTDEGQAAMALPYAFALGSAPIRDTHDPPDTCWGVATLLWPASHPRGPSAGEAEELHRLCRRLAGPLRRAEEEGEPHVAEEEPVVLSRPRPRTPAPDEALAAADLVEGLPDGWCAVDLSGVVAYVNSRAAELLDTRVDALLGRLPDETVPWLGDPIIEDRYRTAIFSREPLSFSMAKPSGEWLTFHVYPGPRGITIRICPAPERTAADERPPELGLPHAPAEGGALYQLLQLGAALTQAVGVKDVVETVAEQVMSTFEAQGLIIYVAEGGRLRSVGCRGLTRRQIERYDNAPLHPPPSPPAKTLVNRAPAFYDSREELVRDYPGLRGTLVMRAWAFLPLITSGRSVGCLVLTYDRNHHFTSEERAVLTSLSSLISQALDRARLYDAKHQLVLSLQAGLLPHRLPDPGGLSVAARYLPATEGIEIGGDFYDVISLDTCHTAVAIGDVQGHNVRAAALMGQVRTAVHATAGAAPGEVLRRTNRLLTDLDPGLFTSCLYGHYDRSTHRLRLASAGHPPPLLRHPDGRADLLPVPPGLLLGIDPEAEYPETEIALPPGSVLLMYTDGLIETPGEDLEDSALRLAGHLVRADEQRLDALADTLLHGTHHAETRDDIALLLLRTAD